MAPDPGQRGHAEDKRGLVINVSSVAGSTVSGSSIPYAVRKAGLEHMTRCLAVAMGPEVRVNAIAPGYIETERTREWAVRDQVVQHAARLGMPSDLATAFLTLIDATTPSGLSCRSTAGSGSYEQGDRLCRRRATPSPGGRTRRRALGREGAGLGRLRAST
ncbi:SDR family oxidoreductase [Nocardioides eburneiflavus]|uniref:SDR family oxidoreductase n=1 Tax=Nocardioides eburneiflavus TaxID=2518372 RepID=A0A4Z1C6U2_9ACTN|nr:SDR family oxidoreductase [Nocardioides eburneiflavus]